MSNRRTKKQKELAEKRRKDKWLSKRSDATMAMLSTLGVLDHFRRLRPAVRENVLKIRYKRPEVFVDPTAESDPESGNVRERLQDTLNECSIPLGDQDEEINLKAFLSVGIALWHQFGMSKPRPTQDETVNVFQEHLNRSTAKYVGDNIDLALNKLIGSLENQLLWNCRIDRKLFWISASIEPTPEGSRQFQIVLHVHHATKREIVVDGKRKRLVPCGAAFGLKIEWVSWTLPEITGKDHPIPVFMDVSHALPQFRKRVTIEQDNGEVDDSMWQSLRSPIIVRMPGRDTVDSRVLPPGAQA